MTFQKFINMAWSLLISLSIFLIADVRAQDYSKTECLPGKEESTVRVVNVQCPDGMKIAIAESLFGRNKWGSCMHTVGDCTDKVDLFKPCDGKEKCSIPLAKTYTPQCGYPTFLKILYDCISETVVTVSVIQPTTPLSRVWSPPIAIRDDTPDINPDVPNSEEVGLIAGCVVAVIVTVIMLLFAIFLVIKRLFKPPVSDTEKGPDGRPQKPDIVIFDFCFCGQTEPEKRRPVADQNQNTQRAASLSISDRPAPIGEVTETNVTEFRHDDETVQTHNTEPVVGAASTEGRLQRSQRVPSSHATTHGANTAVGIPNTNTSTLC